MKPKIELLICDLDNTLYDWVTFFSIAFYEMVDRAVRTLGVREDVLLDELQSVHRHYHNSEQPFALLETRSVRTAYPNATRRELLATLTDAFHAFNSARKAHLRPYPGVVETLQAIDRLGTKIVAHTEATVVNAEYRLHKLGLSAFFARLYAVEHVGEPHPAPDQMQPVTPVQSVRPLMLHERKPDKRVLDEICTHEGVPPSGALYVGDSIVRDIGMARAAGVHSAWAKYGTKYSPEHWQRLVRVTHWTAEDVERAQKAASLYSTAQPDVVLDSSFSELLSYFEFCRPMPRALA